MPSQESEGVAGPLGNPQLCGLNVWRTLGDFHKANMRREHSLYMDFPGMQDRWTDRRGWHWIIYFMQDTNEFVGQRVDQYDIGDQWLGLPPLSTAETLPGTKDQRRMWTGGFARIHSTNCHCQRVDHKS